jgi:hypothetical protein
LDFSGPRLPSSIPEKVIGKVPLRRYSVVLDLNGVLIYRGVYVAGRERSVKLRPGCSAFLDWLSSQALVSFWTSIADKNISRVVDVVLQGTSLKREGVQVLSQSDCTRSSYVESSNPHKPFFLKNLNVFAKLLGLESVEDVLLVDDSPQKNLLNDVHSAVHPPTWSGDDGDRFITMHLQPWLEGLFRSSEVVTEYVKRAPLPGGQLPVDRMSDLAVQILRGVAV